MKVLSILFISALAGAAVSLAVSDTEMLVHNEFNSLLNFLSDVVTGRNSENSLLYESFRGQKPFKAGAPSTVGAFSFSNCADPSQESLVPAGVTLKPDPLRLPGNVTAGGSAQIKKAFGSPLKVALDVHIKKLGFWVEVPCLDGVGSCTYDDVCKSLDAVKTCPPAIVKAGLTCKCPFKPGNYAVNSTTVTVKTSVPVSGDLRVKAEVTNNGQLVTCAQIYLTLA